MFKFLGFLLTIHLSLLSFRLEASEIELHQNWTSNSLAETRYVITGTEARNNPLRRLLKKPFVGDELYVRYRLRYDAQTLDTPETDEGEFFVLWLDREEGSDSSTHSGNVPNIGLHVSDDQNHFMVRNSFSAENQHDGDSQLIRLFFE
jgi:hypothetical protein